MKLLTILILSLVLINSYAHEGKYVDYSYNGNAYQGYFIGDYIQPLIILVHDWDGLTDYEVKRAHMLNQEGYSVFAVDLFGKGVRPTKTSEKKHQTGLLYKDRNKMRALLNAGLQAAKKQNADITNAFALGYCFGGAVVLESARNGDDYKGFISFHGGLSTPSGQNYSRVKGDIVVFHGSADTAIPLSQFADLAQRLEEAKIPHQMTTYGDAPHAFTVFDSSRYRKDADEKSWQSFLSFLRDKK